MKTSKQKKLRKGFACLSKEQRSSIARKGGQKISQDREHMAKLGAKGGKRTQRLYKLVKRAWEKGKTK